MSPRRIVLRASLLLALMACDEPPPPAEPTGEVPASPSERGPAQALTAGEPPRPPSAAAPSTAAPPAAQAEAAPEEAPAEAPPAAPPAGCAFAEPHALQPGAWSAIAAGSQGFVVAASAHPDGREAVTVRGVGVDGASRVLTHGALAHPVPPQHRRAGPALASAGGRLALVLVDGERRVLIAELAEDATDASLTWSVVGEGASHRFAPALTAVGDAWAVAWTSEQGGMRVHGALVRRGQAPRARELRAPAGGSAAPAFVAGARAPTLLFVDPRVGLSVLHRVAVSADGFAEPAVALPVSLVREPPALVAARAGQHDWAAYTTSGSAATASIGLVRLAETDAPPRAPLVPETGYGVLHLAAAALPGDRAVFVGDAPQEPPPTAPRELHVRVLDGDGALSEPAVVRGPSGAAHRGRIASSNGAVAVSFTDGDQVHVALGRCAE